MARLAGNPWFARNVANIVWAHFLGVGIVDPVDDVRDLQPASNPELLDALAEKFVDYNYDFSSSSATSAPRAPTSSPPRTNETNATDNRNFAHAMVRRMRAEVLLDCISQVTDTPNKFKGLPLGARAVQIADGNTSNYFLTTFGRATRATVCSCEVKMEPNLSQALHLLNGDATHSADPAGQTRRDHARRKEDRRRKSSATSTCGPSAASRSPMKSTKLLAAVEEGKDPPKSSRSSKTSSGRC